MSCAHDIAVYIQDTLGEGTLATDLFVNLLFESPDNQVAVHEYGGRQSDMAMGSVPDADALEHVSVQVAVRNTNAKTAMDKAYRIYKALDGKGGFAIGSTAYDYMRALQPPFISKRDDAMRTTVTTNYWITKRRSA